MRHAFTPLYVGAYPFRNLFEIYESKTVSTRAPVNERVSALSYVKGAQARTQSGDDDDQ
jgi:hypothetical protein